MKKDKKIVAILQARMGSTRLPGKTITEICETPLLQHIIERMKYSTLINDLVVATTESKEDDVIIDLCHKLKIKSFRGSERDVLDRFYRCAKKYNADFIIRITADDPFKDPVVVDRIIGEILEGEYDYVSNTIHPTYPEGLDVEVFTFEALGQAWRESSTTLHREHVTPYMWLNPNKFKIKNIKNERNLSNMRWTLDTPEDLAFTKAVYEELYVPGKLFLMKDVLTLLKKHPQLTQINADIEQFAGQKRIMEEVE